MTEKRRCDGKRLWENAQKRLRQSNIVNLKSILEQRCYVGILKPGDTTTHAGDKEFILGMFPRKFDKLIHIGLDGRHRPMHGGNSIGVSLKANTLTPDGTKIIVSCKCRATAVSTLEIASLCKRLHKAVYVKSEIM